jgi:hypothetical protein
MNRQELRVFLLEILGCFCGMPDAAIATILRLLRLHPLHENYAELNQWLAEDGVRYLLLYSLDAWKLTEHGYTVNGAWLTPKGIQVRDALAAEEADGFKALLAEHCAHGFDMDDEGHSCIKAEAERK